jgi:hypothetical protein
VLLVLLLQVEGPGRPDAIHGRATVAAITIRLAPVEPAAAVRPRERDTLRPLPASVPAPEASAPTLLPGPAEGTAGPAAISQPTPVDWSGQASTVAARVAREAESPRTFGLPRESMRKPCTPRTHYDKAVREQMEPLMPETHDPVPPGGIAAPSSSVKMGGVRVGIARIGGDGKESQEDSSGSGRRSSFKWQWESAGMGNGGFEELLTSGWAEPRAYGGMFDDMRAGRTPRSSVPDPDTCD